MAGAEILRGILIGGDMTEEELLAGVTEALGYGTGWRWTHIRRSDGITQGHPGLPDIIAVNADRGLVLAWELKVAKGVVTRDQHAWLFGLDRAAGVDARIIRPVDYDDALAVILRGLTPREAFGPDVRSLEDFGQ